MLSLQDSGYTGIEFWYAGHLTSFSCYSNPQLGLPDLAYLVVFQCNIFGRKRTMDDAPMPWGVREGNFKSFATFRGEENAMAISGLNSSQFENHPTSAVDIDHTLCQN